MEPEGLTPPRSEPEILADLDRLCQAPGFIYTFSLMTAWAMWMSTEDVAEIDWHQRPNNQELSLLLGLLVKHPLKLDDIPTEEAFQQQADEACELLDELHRSCALPALDIHGQETGFGQDHAHDPAEAYQEWMVSGRGMVEPIFYGGEGAYIFQYLEMAVKRYAADEAWLQHNVGIGVPEILAIARALEQLSIERLRTVDLSAPHEQVCRDVFSAMSFHPDELPRIERRTLDNFLTRFSIVPGTVNRKFDSIGAYNRAHSHPAVALGDGRYWLPLPPNLPQSIYESPYYWMMEDERYKDTALKNRGDATEIITRDLLVPVFGRTRVHRGVVVRKGRADLTDLDVLAISGNKALIVQCKSKKLTLTARAGHGQTLRRDFMQAVQDAYDQALTGRQAILRGGCTFTDSDGKRVRLPDEIDEVYILCVTGDHYPAVIPQARTFLRKGDEDPDPIMMSVFDLDVVSHYLRDRFDFLYYVRQRSDHVAYFFADSELALLGFHLRHKLSPDDEYGGTLIDQSYSQLVDANFLVSRGNWPDAPAAQRLSHEWKNPQFDQLIHDIKLAAARQRTRQASAEDALFSLFDQAGNGADQLINMVQRLKRATLRDGEMHDARLPMPESRQGTTIVSFPAPTHPLHEQAMLRDLHGIALAHKYRSRADEWLTLAAFADTPSQLDVFGYIKEPWRQDPQMERFVSSRLVAGRAVNARGDKLGRNQKCPCGSGRKFKRCCGLRPVNPTARSQPHRTRSPLTGNRP